MRHVSHAVKDVIPHLLQRLDNPAAALILKGYFMQDKIDDRELDELIMHFGITNLTKMKEMHILAELIDLKNYYSIAIDFMGQESAMWALACFAYSGKAEGYDHVKKLFMHNLNKSFIQLDNILKLSTEEKTKKCH